jgi:hypothetical protein
MDSPPTPPDQPPRDPGDQPPATETAGEGAHQPAAPGYSSRGGEPTDRSRSRHRWLWPLFAVLLVLAIIAGVIASENKESAQSSTGTSEPTTVNNVGINIEQGGAPATPAPEKIKEVETTKEVVTKVVTTDAGPERTRTRTAPTATGSGP